MSVPRNKQTTTIRSLPPKWYKTVTVEKMNYFHSSRQHFSWTSLHSWPCCRFIVTVQCSGRVGVAHTGGSSSPPPLISAYLSVRLLSSRPSDDVAFTRAALNFLRIFFLALDVWRSICRSVVSRRGALSLRASYCRLASDLLGGYFGPAPVF